MKLTYQITESTTDRELEFITQLGVEWVSINLAAPVQGDFALAVNRARAAGLQVANVADKRLRNISEVVLGLPGRDERVAAFKDSLRQMGDLGLDYTTYAHMANGIWTSGDGRTRGGAATRRYDPDDAYGFWIDERFYGPLSHGRVWSEQEIWDNLARFLDEVLPVAEEAGVRIGVHPDDPPAPVLAGIPRPAFSSLEGYQRVLDTFDSPMLGVCLCVGTWLEGGERTGDPLKAIEEFARRGVLWKVHLRNVSGPLPAFTETFLDDGRGDMPQIVRALHEANFDGIVIADHVPDTAYGREASWAFALGYLRGLISATAPAS